MHRTGPFAVCVLLRRDIPTHKILNPSVEKRLEAEAEEKGFMRRDSPDAKVYMEENLHRSEIISSGVPVANFPPAVKDQTEFDVYQRSTRDFASQVTPHSITGVGLGAGFGAKEDKRLSFLRPRKLQPFGGNLDIVPKYDENGMPIDESLSKDQLRKQRLAYMKSFEGTTMSHREHFLLVDLDFEKDAALFGHTREEFERNVTKLKQVISAYTRWERTDNFYYYGTIALKLLTAWVLMECVQQYYELSLLAAHFDDFSATADSTLRGLSADRSRDFARAREELRANPPNFAPIVAALRAEKRRLASAAAHPMDTTGEVKAAADAQRREVAEEMRRMRSKEPPRGGWLSSLLRSREPPLKREDFAHLSYAASPTSIETVRAVRRVLLPRSEDYTQVVREEMIEHRRRKETDAVHPD